MATIRQTIYRCDVCGDKQEKKSDLVSIRTEKGTHGYGYSGNSNVKGVKADFCVKCEVRLLDAIGAFYGPGETEEALSRKPKKAVLAKP